MKKQFLFFLFLNLATTVLAQVEQDSIFLAPENQVQTKSKDSYERTYISENIYWVHVKNEYTKDIKIGLEKNGRLILPAIFSLLNYEGLEVKPKDKFILLLGKRHGIFDITTETWSVPLIYDELSYFSTTQFIACIGKNYGIIDTQNNNIVPIEWRAIKQFQKTKDYIKVKSAAYPNFFYGIYNINQNALTVPCDYSEILELRDENFFRVRKADNKRYNFIDFQNNSRLGTWYDELHLPRENQAHYIVKKDGKMGIITKDEKILAPIEYQKISQVAYKNGNYLATNRAKKLGCIRRDGTISLPFVYDRIKGSVGSLPRIAVRANKFGLLSMNDSISREVIPFDYDSIRRLKQVLIVHRDKKIGLTDLYGKPISKLIYDEIITLKSLYDLICTARLGDKWFILNAKGEQISNNYSLITTINMDLRNTGYYSSHQFRYLKTSNQSNKYGLINLHGIEIIKPIFDEIIREDYYQITVKIDGKLGIYNILSKKYDARCIYDEIIVDKEKRIYYGLRDDAYYLLIANGTVKNKKL